MAKYDRKEIIIRKNMNMNKESDKYHTKWTKQEEEFLINNEQELSLLELSRVLKRTPWSISNKKKTLKKKRGAKWINL